MNPLIWSLQFQLLIFSWWTSAMNTGTSSNAALFLYWRPCSWSYAWRSSQKTLRPWVWKVKQTSLTWRWSFRNELGDGWRIGFDWWFGQISWHRFFWSKSKLLNPLCFVFCFQKKHIFVLRWVVCIRIYIYISASISLDSSRSFSSLRGQWLGETGPSFGASEKAPRGETGPAGDPPVGVCWCSWVRGGGC